MSNQLTTNVLRAILHDTDSDNEEEAEECNVVLNFVPEDDPDLQNLGVVDSNRGR